MVAQMVQELIIELEKPFYSKLKFWKKRGYSKAVLDGIKASEIIFGTDSDNQIKVNSLIENINNLPRWNIFIWRKNTKKRSIHEKFIVKCSRLFMIYFNSNLSDPNLYLVKKKLLKNCQKSFYSKWEKDFGGVLWLSKKEINFNEVKIQHFKRSEENWCWIWLSQIPGIIVRNTIGLFIIKLSNFKSFG